jgi:hypothetical protein
MKNYKSNEIAIQLKTGNDQVVLTIPTSNVVKIRLRIAISPIIPSPIN